MTLLSASLGLWLTALCLLGGFVILVPYARWKVNQIKKRDQQYAQTRGWSYEELQEVRKRKRNRKIPASHRKQVLRRDLYQCQHCGSSSSLSVDHIFPFSRGGGHEIENLQVLCKSCNQKKSDALP